MFVLMDEIVDHRKDALALDKNEGIYYNKSGTLKRKITMAG